MELGFQTAGNATLVVHDHGPLLVTDPWFDGPAYFGSWVLSHQIPDQVRAHIANAGNIWISHGHPDHLSSESLEGLRASRILLPDHVGSRIADHLRAEGFHVAVLPDRRWYSLSDRVRVLCFADATQDAVLLVDVAGTLIVNINDTSNSGWIPFLRRIVSSYPVSYVLAASGFGDIRGMNYFDEAGRRLDSVVAVRRKREGFAVGAENARLTDLLGGRFFVPFSSMHRYQRDDSAWANEFVTELGDYEVGYESNRSSTLPAYIEVDISHGNVTQLGPSVFPTPQRPPSDFGDDWSEQLSNEDKSEIDTHFRSIEHLCDHLDFVGFAVGGSELIVPLRRNNFQTGLTFEVPRKSLVTAVRYEIFEDLMLGNFMRTVVHGVEAERGLTEMFDYQFRYAENGKARTRKEVDAYLSEYRRRQGRIERIRHGVEQAIVRHAHRNGSRESAIYRVGRSIYRRAVYRSGS